MVDYHKMNHFVAMPRFCHITKTSYRWQLSVHFLSFILLSVSWPWNLIMFIHLYFDIAAVLPKIGSWFNISINTKIRIYKSLVRSVLLYACEPWTLTQSDTQRLVQFEQSCLRSIWFRTLTPAERNHLISNKIFQPFSNICNILNIEWPCISNTIRERRLE